MSDYTVARRYAQALYEEADEQRQLERVDEDVEVIRDTLAESGELVRFFESPVISREKKGAVVEGLFAERLNSTTLHFLQLLIDKKREALVPVVVRSYQDLRDEHLGVVEARARFARPMGADEQEQLVDQLEQMTGKQIRLQTSVEPDLIGGLIVRIGDTVYDGSVRHQLEVLHDRMEVGVSINGAGT